MSKSFNQKVVNKIFLFKYFHDGRWWSLELPASDEHDAQERVRKLPQSEFLGELKGTVPASDEGFSPVLRLLTE